ncbi:MAG: hypothetical protein Q9162_005964 [Coniocarpon cinnabarinum]
MCRSIVYRQKYAAGVSIFLLNNKSRVRAREEFRSNAKVILAHGYEKYRDRPFYVPTPLGERLMIPPQYVDELRSAWIDDVDFLGTFKEMFEGKYTTFGDRSQLHPTITRGPLTQNIGKLLPGMFEEIEECYQIKFPKGDCWQVVDAGELFLGMIARITSRMFAGKDLSHHETWVATSIAFAIDGFVSAQTLKRYPSLLKPVVAIFLSSLRRIKQHHRTAQQAICPIIETRKADGAHKSVDAVQWMMDEAKEGESDSKFIANIVLKLSFASIHTSSGVLLNILYNLCYRAEYIEPLRTEARKVLDEEGQWNRNALEKLVKLDSFMIESQRFSPLLLSE